MAKVGRPDSISVSHSPNRILGEWPIFLAVVAFHYLISPKPGFLPVLLRPNPFLLVSLPKQVKPLIPFLKKPGVKAECCSALNEHPFHRKVIQKRPFQAKKSPTWGDSTHYAFPHI
jgi:hypothetical protein